MPILTENFTTIAHLPDKGSIAFWAPELFQSSSGVITPEVVVFALVNGILTTTDMIPGRVKMQARIGFWTTTYDVVLPDVPTIRLFDLIGMP